MDRENVVKAIDICLGHGKCNDCPFCFSGKGYTTMNCRDYMLRDALSLIDTQYKLILELQNLISIGTKMMNGDEA